MKIKKRNIALAGLAASVALLLATPTATFATPFIPDGSAPYGADTICYFDGDLATEDASASTCSPIPSTSWGTVEIPTATTDFLTNAQLSALDWVGIVANQGSTQSGTPGTNSNNFYVAPSDPAALPFIGSSTLTAFGHNTEVAEVTGVSAYFVADSTIVASADPYASVPSGSRSTLVSDGRAVPVPVTPLGDGSYDVTLTAPSPTWSWSTDGTLNGYGWSGQIVIVIEGTSNGEAVTQVVRNGLNFYSSFLYDIRNFYVDAPLNEGEVGVAGGSYPITGEVRGIASPPVVVEPPVVEPPVVEPPVVEPPVVQPPVTPEPEPTPDGPRVESGADTSQPLSVWFPIALAAAVLMGLFPTLFALRRRERAEQ